MIYTVKFTKQFKKDYKKCEKHHKDMEKLHKIITMLAKGETLPPIYNDHALSGKYKPKRECHVTPDWLLIYEYDNNDLILWLARTGSHSETL